MKTWQSGFIFGLGGLVLGVVGTVAVYEGVVVPRMKDNIEALQSFVLMAADESGSKDDQLAALTEVVEACNNAIDADHDLIVVYGNAASADRAAIDAFFLRGGIFAGDDSYLYAQLHSGDLKRGIAADTLITHSDDFDTCDEGLNQ